MKKEEIVMLVMAAIGFLCPVANVVLNHESVWVGAAFAAVTGIFLGVGDFLFFRHDWKSSGIDALCCLCGGVIGALLLAVIF